MNEENPFELFWQTYPLDLCTRRGSKAKAKVIFDKLDDEMKNKITIQLRELMRADRAMKKTGQFVSRWPMVTTWLNGERWNDIDDLEPNKHREYAKKKCTCGADVEIADKCWGCYGEKDKATKEHMQYLYDNLCEMGLDIRSFPDKGSWIAACKERAIPRLARLRQANGLGKV